MNPSNVWHKWTAWESDFYSLAPQDDTIFYPISDGLSNEDLAKYLNDNNAENVYNNCKIYSNHVSRYDTDIKANGVDLPAGFYEFQSSNNYPHNRLIPITIRDDMFVKTEGVYQEVMDEFKAFIDNEELYKELGCIYKRAVLMYGPPGFGKTAIIRQIIKNEIPKDAVVIFFNYLPGVDYITSLAKTLGDRMKVLVFEELVYMLDTPHVTQQFLEFMDGEKSLRKSFIFGTTNYPEKLPENMVNRPSRWDRLIKMKGLTKEGKIELMKHYLKKEPTEEEFILIKDFSTAAIKEVCFMMRLHGLSFEEAVDKMNNHIKMFKNEFEERGKLGLG